MRWLLYGSRGWIGQQIVALLQSLGSNEIIEGTSRIDDYQTTYDEIKTVNPDRVICTTGRTSGQGCSNIDYLEQKGKLVENLRDNLHGPINLASICQSLNIHVTYLGTACVYQYDHLHPIGGKGYTEEDINNFYGSQYSMVKGTTDRLIRQFNTTLNARIRMPITADSNPRNFVTKITQYKKVISIPNSMSVLPELLPIMIDMSINKVVGTVNLTNPGAITHQEILDIYKKYVDPTFTYEIMGLEELSKYAVAGRSNNYLDTTKLQTMYPNVRPIKESVDILFKETFKLF